MKFKVVLAGLVVGASFATSAMAAGPYVGASGGVTIVHDSDIDITGVGSGTLSYNTGGGFNIFGGYDFGTARLEGEFGYKTAGIDKLSGPGGSVSMPDSDLNIKSYMVNGYYDFKNDSPYTPFVGVGLGLVNGEFKVEGSKDDIDEFGYQVTVGVSYKYNPNLNFDLSYRYQAAASDFSKDGTSISYGSSNINVGFRCNF